MPIDPKLEELLAGVRSMSMKGDVDLAKAMQAIRRVKDDPAYPKTPEYDPHRVIECVVCGSQERLQKCSKCRSTVCVGHCSACRRPCQLLLRGACKASLAVSQALLQAVRLWSRLRSYRAACACGSSGSSRSSCATGPSTTASSSWSLGRRARAGRAGAAWLSRSRKRCATSTSRSSAATIKRCARLSLVARALQLFKYWDTAFRWTCCGNEGGTGHGTSWPCCSPDRQAAIITA